jgi:hypothetical protein
MNKFFWKLWVLPLLTIIMIGVLSCTSDKQKDNLFESITSSETLSKKINQNLDKKIYILFYYSRMSETYQSAIDIAQGIQKNDDTLILQVPVDDIGFGIAEEYKLKMMPTLIVYQQGKEILRLVKHSEIRKWLSTRNSGK